jgi:hypothetical protein
MAFNGPLRIAASLLLAATVTGSLYFVDIAATESRQRDLALRYMRQVATQIESLAVKAQEERRRDPVGYAISYFSQGAEPRVLTIEKIRLENEPSLPPIASRDGWFELSRVIRADEGQGVKMRLALGEIGFLGSYSRLSNDAYVVLAFSLFFALAWLTAGARDAAGSSEDQSELKARIKNWIATFRIALTEMGAPIRDSLKNTQAILAGVKQSAWLAHKLRRGIHEQLASIHRSRKDISQTGSLADTIVRLASELAAASPDDERVRTLLHHAHNMRALEQKNQILLRRLEIQLEPWATDSDLLVAQLGQLSQSTDQLRHQVRETTSRLLSQAQAFREVAVDDEAASAAATK